MKPQNAWFYLWLVTLAAACGGTVSKSDVGSAGTSSSGGNGNEAGASARSGSPSVGGSFGTAGALSLGGGPNCATVGCPPVACTEEEVAVLTQGACCQTCKPRAGGCEEVTCEPVEACPEGYELAQPPGACCLGCVPKTSGVPCDEIACPQTSCPLGYTRGDLLGGCCYDCVPDPLYCRDNDDCVMADKPRECCGCPEAITLRQYELEPCWSEVGSPRPLPSTCYPQATCDALCAPCVDLGDAADCSEHRCVARGYGLK